MRSGHRCRTEKRNSGRIGERADLGGYVKRDTRHRTVGAEPAGCCEFRAHKLADMKDHGERTEYMQVQNLEYV